jgi:hypothetical protein
MSVLRKWLRAEELLPNHRVDAVCSYQQTDPRPSATGEASGDTLAVARPPIPAPMISAWLSLFACISLFLSICCASDR